MYYWYISTYVGVKQLKLRKNIVVEKKKTLCKIPFKTEVFN